MSDTPRRVTPGALTAGARGALRLEDLRLRARLRVLMRVREVQQLAPGAVISLNPAVLVAGEGAGTPVADVRVEGHPDTGIRARVVRAHPSPVEALLGAAVNAPTASGPGRDGPPVVSRSRYAVFRSSGEEGAPAEPLGRHAVAVARLQRVAAEARRLAARAPDVVEDGTLAGIRDIDRWLEGLVALGRPGASAAGFGPWFDRFLSEWLDPLLVGLAGLFGRVRLGGVSAQAGEVAVALSNVLVEELPDAFLEEGVTLLLVRPLDAVFDPVRMREVGRQETLGFDGRVVAQRSAGVERGGTVVRPADVVVAG